MNTSLEGKAMIGTQGGKIPAKRGRKSKATLEAEKALLNLATESPMAPALAHHAEESNFAEKAISLNKQIIEKLAVKYQGNAVTLGGKSLENQTYAPQSNMDTSFNRSQAFGIGNFSSNLSEASVYNFEPSDSSIVSKQQHEIETNVVKPKGVRGKGRKNKAEKLSEMAPPSLNTSIGKKITIKAPGQAEQAVENQFNAQSDTSSSEVNSIKNNASLTTDSQNDSSFMHSSSDISANSSTYSANATYSNSSGIENDFTTVLEAFEATDSSLVKPKAVRKGRKSKAAKLAEMALSNPTLDANDYSVNTSNEDGSLTLNESIPAIRNSGQTIKVPAKKGRKSKAAKLQELINHFKQEQKMQPETTNIDDNRKAQKRLSGPTETPFNEEVGIKRRREEETSEKENLNVLESDKQIQMRNVELERKLKEMTQLKGKLEKDCGILEQACDSHLDLSKCKDEEIGNFKDQVTRLTQIASEKQYEISTLKLIQQRVFLENNKLQKELKKVEEITTGERKYSQSVKSSLDAIISQNLALFEKVLGSKSALETETDTCDVIALIFGDYVKTKIDEQVKAEELKKSTVALMEKLIQKDNQILELKAGHDDREAHISKLLKMYNDLVKREQAQLKQLDDLEKSSMHNQTQMTKYKKKISELKTALMPKMSSEFGEEVVESLKAELAKQEAERRKQTADHLSSMAAFKSEVSLTNLIEVFPFPLIKTNLVLFTKRCSFKFMSNFLHFFAMHANP